VAGQPKQATDAPVATLTHGMHRWQMSLALGYRMIPCRYLTVGRLTNWACRSGAHGCIANLQFILQWARKAEKTSLSPPLGFPYAVRTYVLLRCSNASPMRLKICHLRGYVGSNPAVRTNGFLV